ncbi:MAG: alpha/beta hydrolase [Candidatus Aegiribacteria sp.]|nr:alpha/beta hydrolase [Candidatus Aegiribacteria sp.]
MKRSLLRSGFTEMKYDTGRLLINYAQGPPGETPLFLIPGQTMPWESYTRVLKGLSEHFEIYAVDVHGHGSSGWIPDGEYRFSTMGADFVSMLNEVVCRPAIVSGNSSGGLLAAWIAANAPESVLGIVTEDPPFFSSEWPRLRDDTYVYRIMKLSAETLMGSKGRDLSAFFKEFELPVEGKKRLMTLPKPLSLFISMILKVYQGIRRGEPVDLPFLPLDARLFIRGLSEYDPKFSASFLDCSPVVDFDHTEILSRINCPLLLMHAHWFRHDRFGLVGALDDDDVERVRSLVGNFRYRRIETGHVMHLHRPVDFIDGMLEMKEWVREDQS